MAYPAQLDTMHASSTRALPSSSAALWAGRVLTTLAALFLAFDAAVKLMNSPFAVEATARIGFPASMLLPLGLIEAAFLVLYLVPRTAPLGAILWTGYLGGAVAANVRMGTPLFSNVLFPVYFAAIMWTALYLRDRRVRSLSHSR